MTAITHAGSRRANPFLFLWGWAGVVRPSGAVLTPRPLLLAEASRKKD